MKTEARRAKKVPVPVDDGKLCLTVDRDGIPPFPTIVDRFMIASEWRSLRGKNTRGQKAWKVEDFLVWTVTPDARAAYWTKLNS
jgi:hypothetical protein